MKKEKPEKTAKELTVPEVARRLRKPYPTVSLWVRQGRFPNARYEQTPRGGVWWIPESDVSSFTPPKPGRPSINANKKGKAAKERVKRMAKAEADRYYNLVKMAHPKLLGPEQNTWLDRLDYERENLHAALTYFKKYSPSKMLELAIDLGHFWYLHGYWSEGKEVLQFALEKQQPEISQLKARGLCWLGYLLLRLDEYEPAKHTLSESITMSRELDDKECLAFSLHALGFVVEAEGDYERAKSLFTESLQSSRAVNSHWLIGEALCGLGIIAEIQSDYAAAKEHYSQYHTNSEKIEDLRGIASALNCLGAVAREQGDYSEARRMHERSLALRQGLGNKNGMAYCQFDLGTLEEVTGQHQEARRCFQRGLALCQDTGNKLWMVRTMEGIAKMTSLLGREEDAAHIYGAADAIRISISAPLTPSEQKNHGEVITTVKGKFPSAWEDGKQQPLNEAITFALTVSES